MTDTKKEHSKHWNHDDLEDGEKKVPEDVSN